MDVRIIEVTRHYGLITAWVEPYRTVDYLTGKEIEVHMFYLNGCLTTCEGYRVKKDGNLYAGMSCVSVRTPKNVKDALDSFSQD